MVNTSHLDTTEIRIDNKLLEINYKDFLVSNVNQENKCTGWMVKQGKDLSKFSLYTTKIDNSLK